MTLEIFCVLRSGGDYDAGWVRRLRDGVARHLSLPHRFACLSDVDVPCERIPLVHDWPGWWSKLELFRPGVVTGPALYLDLDTVIVGDFAKLAATSLDFAMLELKPDWGNALGQSGVMWFRRPQHQVYDRFAVAPEGWMQYHAARVKHRYAGDQAFISDCFGGRPPKLEFDGTIRSYKRHCRHGLPEGTAIVAFHGRPRPNQVGDEWVRRAWM